MTHDEITKALLRLRPGAIWSLMGDDYSAIDWQSSDMTKPTLAELQAEIENPTLDLDAINAKAAVLEKLGLTQEEVAILLS